MGNKLSCSCAPLMRKAYRYEDSPWQSSRRRDGHLLRWVWWSWSLRQTFRTISSPTLILCFNWLPHGVVEANKTLNHNWIRSFDNFFPNQLIMFSSGFSFFLKKNIYMYMIQFNYDLKNNYTQKPLTNWCGQKNKKNPPKLPQKNYNYNVSCFNFSFLPSTATTTTTTTNYQL